jgi:hypothetical protein
MMVVGEFVAINSSVGEIVTAAQSLIADGAQFVSVVDSAKAMIGVAESDGKVFPPDDFTDAFHPGYQKKASGVLAAARGLGGSVSGAGQFVRDGVLAVDAADREGGGAIGNVV